MEKQQHAYTKALIICVILFLIAAPILFKVFIINLIHPTLSNNNALGIINSALGLELSPSTITIIEKDYDTNFREEGYLIVCDLNNTNIEQLAHFLDLTETSLPIALEGDDFHEFNNLAVRYYYGKDSVYFRYGINRLMDGTEHAGSVYLILLSNEGRLLLYFDG